MIYDLPAWRFSSIFEPILQSVTEVNFEGQKWVLEERVQFQLLQNVFGYSSIILICLKIFFVFHSSHLTIHKQCTMFFLDLNLGLQIAASSHSSLLIVQIGIDDS
jgi:hypothetical protein